MGEYRGGFFEGLATGLVLGVSAYVFLGTDEGKKLKKNLQKKAGPYLDDFEEVLEELKDQSGNLLQKAEEVKDSLEEKLEETTSQVVPAVAEKLDDSLSHIEMLQERGRKATASIRKKFFKNIKKS